MCDRSNWSKDEELWRLGARSELGGLEPRGEEYEEGAICLFDVRETYVELGTPWKVRRLRSWVSCPGYVC